MVAGANGALSIVFSLLSDMASRLSPQDQEFFSRALDVAIDDLEREINARNAALASAQSKLRNEDQW